MIEMGKILIQIVVPARGGHRIEAPDSEFWEAPSLCLDGIVHRKHQSNSTLSYGDLTSKSEYISYVGRS